MRRELRIKLFEKFYEEPLDYTHLTLEKGEMYPYFLENKHPDKLAELTKDNFPIHLSDVPVELVDEYRQYLKDCLIQWGFSSAEKINTDEFVDYTLENFEDQIDCNADMMLEKARFEVIDRLLDAFEEALNGFRQITELWEFVDLNDLRACKIYPFDMSFDEFMSGKLGDWLEANIAELLGDNRTLSEILENYEEETDDEQ